jgi:hypothetical protein
MSTCTAFCHFTFVVHIAHKHLRPQKLGTGKSSIMPDEIGKNAGTGVELPIEPFGAFPAKLRMIAVAFPVMF